MANTRFSYLYRDASNYKNHGDVVFSGEFTPELEEKLTSVLNDGEYFIAHQVGIPEVFLWDKDLEYDEYPVELVGTARYKIDEEDDHVWHEFDGLSLTDAAPTDPRTIEEFIDEVVRQADLGWLDTWMPGDPRPSHGLESR